MSSKRLILVLATATVLLLAGVAWTEYTHRPRTLVIPVSGMSCEGCATTIRESLEKLPGVRDVAVSVEKAEARLTVDGWSETTRENVEDAIEAAGYKVGGGVGG
jgi:copper chaperone CopZ